jgi:hypothetical protein
MGGRVPGSPGSWSGPPAAINGISAAWNSRRNEQKMTGITATVLPAAAAAPSQWTECAQPLPALAPGTRFADQGPGTGLLRGSATRVIRRVAPGRAGGQLAVQDLHLPTRLRRRMSTEPASGGAASARQLLRFHARVEHPQARPNGEISDVGGQNAIWSSIWRPPVSTARSRTRPGPGHRRARSAVLPADDAAARLPRRRGGVSCSPPGRTVARRRVLGPGTTARPPSGPSWR